MPRPSRSTPIMVRVKIKLPTVSTKISQTIVQNAKVCRPVIGSPPSSNSFTVCARCRGALERSSAIVLEFSFAADRPVICTIFYLSNKRRSKFSPFQYRDLLVVCAAPFRALLKINNIMTCRTCQKGKVCGGHFGNCNADGKFYVQPLENVALNVLMHAEDNLFVCT